MANDDLQRIVPVEGDGVTRAVGQVEMQTGLEMRPCMFCRSFERDQKKLTEHLIACGLEAQPDGTFMTPIRKDFVDAQGLRRANQRLDPRKFGFCRFECRVVEDQATCEAWTFKASLEGLVK